VMSSVITAVAVPFFWLARREQAPSDPIEHEEPAAEQS